MSEDKDKACTKTVVDGDLGDSEVKEMQGGDVLSPLASDPQLALWVTINIYFVLS